MDIREVWGQVGQGADDPGLSEGRGWRAWVTMGWETSRWLGLDSVRGAVAGPQRVRMLEGKALGKLRPIR